MSRTNQSLGLDVPPQVHDALGVPHDLTTAKFGLSVYPVHKGDGDFAHSVAQRPGPDDDLHLEHVSFRRAPRDDVFDHRGAIQPGRVSQRVDGRRTG